MVLEEKKYWIAHWLFLPLFFFPVVGCQTKSAAIHQNPPSNFPGHDVTTSSNTHIEYAIEKTLEMEHAPLAVEISWDGRWIFVLTDRGIILVYSGRGDLQDRLEVGNHVDGIKAGPRQDMLFLTSRRNKTVEFLSLDFVKNIDVSDSPFKGSPEAPVTIVVFSDFQ